MTPWSQQVLDELLDKVAEADGFLAATVLADSVCSTMELVVSRKLTWRSRPEILNPVGVFSSYMAPYVLYYRVLQANSIEFLSILHSKQDPIWHRMV